MWGCWAVVRDAVGTSALAFFLLLILVRSRGRHARNPLDAQWH
jgi:hypothetical protein